MCIQSTWDKALRCHLTRAIQRFPSQTTTKTKRKEATPLSLLSEAWLTISTTRLIVSKSNNYQWTTTRKTQQRKWNLRLENISTSLNTILTRWPLSMKKVLKAHKIREAPGATTTVTWWVLVKIGELPTECTTPQVTSTQHDSEIGFPPGAMYSLEEDNSWFLQPKEPGEATRELTDPLEEFNKNRLIKLNKWVEHSTVTCSNKIKTMWA